MLAESLGEGEEAERWFRRAAEAREPRSAGRLGRLLAGRGESRAAEPFLETAAEAGDAEAATLLGKLLRARARHWLAVGEQGGSPEAAHLLGDLLFGSGDKDGASASYRKAIAAGYAQVAASYAALLLWWRQGGEAEIWIRRAVDAGDEGAATALDTYTFPLEAELSESATLGTKLAAANLGRFLELRDCLDEARLWYLQGYEQGDSYGAFRLAELHKKAGDEAEAAAWYRKAAALGHLGARRALGEAPQPESSGTEPAG
ncbi:hypothetical protein [Streptomyces noursei]|uniref:hypothetical protein n=1 Tax=Streptomyces noursei TaxID=1971 RepID=UPI0021556B5E|nr:hypothetical protein [Streptomyces noursei]